MYSSHSSSIARYQSKILKRSALYRLCVPLLFVFVIGMQLFMQSQWGVRSGSLAFGVPSFFPLTLA